MITPKIAIDTAVAFLESLNPEHLGGDPKEVRLETIQLFGKEWVVVISYSVSVARSGEAVANNFLNALTTRRYLKEFEIDAEKGEVIAMRNPQTPATIERLAA